MHLRDRGQGVVRAVLRKPQPAAGVLRTFPALLAGLERQRDRHQGAPPTLSATDTGRYVVLPCGSTNSACRMVQMLQGMLAGIRERLTPTSFCRYRTL